MKTGTVARIAGVLSALAGAAVIGNAQPAQAATITVTTQNDYFASGPTGCSLRRAINAANNNSDYNGCTGVGPYGNDVIVFDPAIVTVTLTINTGGGDNDSNGYRDLDIGDATGGSLSIIGPPGGVAIVAGAGLGDRVFDITPIGGSDVAMTNLIIVGGVTPATTYETGASDELCYRGGGGIRRRGNGQLTLTNVRVLDNTARGGGGVCHQGSALRVIGSVIQGNTTQGNDGGGILSAGPTLISGTRVLSNTAVISETNARGGGGVYHAPPSGDAPLEVLGGSVSFNIARRITTTAEAQGGGIATRAPTTLTQVSITSNALESLSPSAQGGGVFSSRMVWVNQSSIVGNVITANFGLGGGLHTSNLLGEINGGMILSNTARQGGGWYNTVAGALLIGSEVRFNRALQIGGGILNAASAGSVGIVNATVCDNRAEGMSPAVGGGLANFGSNGSLYVQGSIVCNNRASSGGGAINNASGSGMLVVESSHIYGNAAVAGSGGGIAQNSAGGLRLDSSALTTNTASASGGALSVVNAGFSALNVTFSGNQGANGAIHVQNGPGYLTYTTIVSNNSAGLWLASGSTVTVRATLLAGNTTANCAISGGTLISANDNLSSDASCAALSAPNDLTNTNPLLRPLGFASPFDFTPTHRPMPNSPALNHIPPARCILTDQRNTPRPQNGACDVGAVELAVWRTYAPITRKP